MAKRTFCCLFHASDCSEECEVTVERDLTPSPSWDSVWLDPFYRLVSYPASCKCGRPVMHCDPPQDVLRDAYHAEDAEDA